MTKTEKSGCTDWKTREYSLIIQKTVEGKNCNYDKISPGWNMSTNNLWKYKKSTNKHNFFSH